jgi:hypothetical protein
MIERYPIARCGIVPLHLVVLGIIAALASQGQITEMSCSAPAEWPDVFYGKGLWQMPPDFGSIRSTPWRAESPLAFGEQ